MKLVDSPRATELIRVLRERVSERTVSHCVFTASLMVAIAEEAAITVEQATDAGLLHDLYKDTDDSASLRLASKFGIVPSEVQRRRPSLLHGALAAEECRRNLGIDDEAILDAIYWHTTGKPGLGPVGLALYFADFAEPSRQHKAAAEAMHVLRKEGYRQALLYASHRKLEHVNSKLEVDPTTVEFHQWLEEFLR